MRKFTWDQLAKAINKLPAEQRKKQVVITFEDDNMFRRVGGLVIIEEDVYVNKTDNEDSGSLTELKELNQDGFVKKDYRLSTKKGTPYLWHDF